MTIFIPSSGLEPLPKSKALAGAGWHVRSAEGSTWRMAQARQSGSGMIQRIYVPGFVMVGAAPYRLKVNFMATEGGLNLYPGGGDEKRAGEGGIAAGIWRGKREMGRAICAVLCSDSRNLNELVYRGFTRVSVSTSLGVVYHTQKTKHLLEHPCLLIPIDSITQNSIV